MGVNIRKKSALCLVLGAWCLELTGFNRLTTDPKLQFGFNKWLKSREGKPKGQDWQTWSAALYLYAAKCVELKSTQFFDKIRKSASELKTAEA